MTGEGMSGLVDYVGVVADAERDSVSRKQNHIEHRDHLMNRGGSNLAWCLVERDMSGLVVLQVVGCKDDLRCC